MKSTTAVALAALLSFPPPSVAAQDSPDSSWARVQRIKAGKTVTLTARDAQPAARIVIGATDDYLMVLNFSNPALPRSVKSALLDMASRGVQDFVNTQNGGTFLTNANVRIALDGMFVADIKVADLADVVERIDRVDVRLITISRRSRWSAVGAVAGGVVGSVVGFYLALGFGLRPCGDSCAGERLRAWLALVGLPVAGGVGGYYATGRNVTDVIYQAPVVRP